MELSHTSIPVFSRTCPSFLHQKYIKTIIGPKKITCMPKIYSQIYPFPSPSKLYIDHKNSNLYQPKIVNFLKIAPEMSSHGRKTIPLIKAHQLGGGKPDSSLAKMLKFFDILLRFIKPYILLGTVTGSTCIMARTWIEIGHLVTLPKWVLFLRAIAIIVVQMTSMGFVSGINQIYDIEIDKINKPYYPLASGELSTRFAWVLVISFLAISIAISLLLKSGCLLTYVLGCFILGSLYSAPPLSMKRSTLGAIFVCTSAGYASVLSLSGAAREIMGLSFQLSMPLIYMAIFATSISFVCSTMKDIEDLEGDKKCNVPTLASIYGPRKVALFDIGFLLLTYVGAIATAVLMPQVFRRCVMIPVHIFLASYLVFQALKLEKENYAKEASKSFHQILWRLYTVEYMLFPFI